MWYFNVGNGPRAVPLLDGDSIGFTAAQIATSKKLWLLSGITYRNGTGAVPYDGIIRNEAEYQKIWGYIDTNPYKCQEDKYFI